MELFAGGFMLKEMKNFRFYNRLLKFVNNKKYQPKSFKVNSNYYSTYILNELTDNQLKIWIRNVFSYDIKCNDKYYVPIQLEDIPRKKMLKWTCYNIYFKSMWQLTKGQILKGERVLQKIEDKLCTKFSENDNPLIYFLKFGNNKIECTYRPLCLINLFNGLRDICYLSLILLNFKRYKLKEENIVYYHYYNKNNRKTVVFIHGFGFGIEPYLYYILRLKKNYNLIVFVLPNISNMEYDTNIYHITHNSIFPEYDTWRDVMRQIIIKHNLNSINFIAHSFGTVILSLFLKDPIIKSKIDKKVFIEPVCFIDKSYKIYRYINEPQLGSYGYISKVFNLIIYKDIYLRYISQRFIYGPEFWITDYQELNGNSLVILSEKDQVVPTDELYEKMIKNNIEVICLKDGYHADMFMSSKYDSVFDKINEFINQEDILLL